MARAYYQTGLMTTTQTATPAPYLPAALYGHMETAYNTCAVTRRRDSSAHRVVRAGRAWTFVRI